MSRFITIEYLEELGYDVVQPAQIFGRSSQLMSGEPLFEGGYRAVEAKEMFGAGSEFGDQVAVSLLEPSFAYTTIYQVLILLSLALYLNMVLRSWGSIGSLWSGLFSMQSERRMAGEGGELPHTMFKTLAIVVGVIMLALVSVRALDLLLVADSPLYSGSFQYAAPLLALLLVGVFVAWLYALHSITEWISQSGVVAELSSVTTLNFVRYIVLLYPLVAAWLVASSQSVEMWGVAVICGTALMLIIYLKDTFVFFIAKKIPILYWILYLCTAFLLPISFVLTVLPACV